jgi:hypothetical protein
MVCEEKGIEYTLTETAIFAPELFTVHPLGKMPGLRHGDVCLFESKVNRDVSRPGIRRAGDISFGAPSGVANGTVGFVH